MLKSNVSCYNHGPVQVARVVMMVVSMVCILVVTMVLMAGCHKLRECLAPQICQ